MGNKIVMINPFSNLFHVCKMQKKINRWTGVFVFVFLLGCHSAEDKFSDWRVYRGDASSASYSSLAQINKENVKELKPAWTFYPDDAIAGARFERSECNPIIIDSFMYVTSARHRVYAINAATGKKIWGYDPFDGGEGGGVNRGVAYWQDGNDKRILFTAGNFLFALNALNGTPIKSFGDSGKVNLNVGMRGDPEKISIVPTSPGIVFKDLLILGTEVSELYGAEPGYQRAYNIKTGKLEWTFHTIPLPGETGYETWPKDAWKYVGGANDWGGMSLDKKRGMVFLATGSPTYDHYGADRKGMNLFGNCVIALDAATGKLKWYYQTVHHDLWDYDLPAPPNLVTVERDGKKIDAVAQVSKTGFLYVLDRETGKPLFPVEERKVPPSDVPGEEAWPTQPFPLKPESYARHFMTENDLSHFSDEAHDSLIKTFERLRYEGMFTPPSTRGTLTLPATVGGAEWGGAAYDPSTNILYVKSNDAPEIALLQKIDPGKNNLKGLSDYSKGKKLYTTYCAGCHGADRKGDGANAPSLLDIKSRMNRQSVLNKIRQGSGRMPSFSNILKGQEKAILSFLFENKNGLTSFVDNNLLEIQKNEQAEKKDPDQKNKKETRFLNVTAYRSFKDKDGNPGIKPPWGTLNAINLNTGEYEWKIPVGNIPELQQPGDPVTGAESTTGPMVTSGGLIFLGGMRDKKLMAFDKKTGEKLWEVTLPGVATSNPCMYMCNGKQFIAVSVSGTEEHAGGSVMSFALP
jgi:quinoprotein glucose dehydrogenase